MLTDVYFLGRLLAFYGSIDNEGISSLGIYYEKISNTLDAEVMFEEEKGVLL